MAKREGKRKPERVERQGRRRSRKEVSAAFSRIREKARGLGDGFLAELDALTDDVKGSLIFGTRNAQNTVEIQVNSGGTLVVGQAGSTGRSLDFGQSCDSSNHTYNEAYACIYIASGGHFNWVATEIQAHTLIANRGEVDIASTDCVLLNEGLDDDGSGSQPQLRINENNGGVDLTGVTLYGFELFYRRNVTTADEIIWRYSNRGFQPANAFPDTTWAILEGTDFTDNVTTAVGLKSGRWARISNNSRGTNETIIPAAGDSSNGYGLTEVRQDITFSLTNGSGAKVYTKDTNNSNRLAASQIQTNPDYVADREYTLTESGGSASYTTDGGVLIGVYYYVTPDGNGVSDFDSRGNANDTTDLMTWLKTEYGRAVATKNIEMKGTSAVSQTMDDVQDFGITESTKATVAAYTGFAFASDVLTISESHSAQEAYDWQKYHESENPDDVWTNGKVSYITSTDGTNFTPSADYVINLSAALTGTATYVGGTFEIDTGWSIASTITMDGMKLDFQNTGTFDLRDNTFLNTTELVNSSGGAVTVKVPIGTTVTNTGPNITVEYSNEIDFTAPNLIDDSGCRLYNVTQAAEVDNSVVSGGSGYSYTATVGSGQEVEVGDVLRLDVAYCVGTTRKCLISATRTAGTSDIEVSDSQTDCPVYNANAIDGSTVTEFSADYPNLEVDIDDPDGETTVQRLFAWSCYNETTADGIRNFFGGLVGEDTANYKVVTTIVDLLLDNVGDAVTVNGGRIYRDDDETVIEASSGAIHIDPGKAFVVTSVENDVAAIRVATDQMTFNGANINANIEAVNALAVAGVGTEDNPWGPA